MAVTQEDLLVKISADAGDAKKQISDVALKLAELSKSMDQTSVSSKEAAAALTGFGALQVKLKAGIDNVTLALQAGLKVYKATVGQFHDYQDEVKRLSNTLALLGEKDVAGAVDRFKELADRLQDTTTLSDDQVLALANIAKATGVTTDMTEKLVKVSADLATATGKDVNESLHALLASLKGHARSLAEIRPEIAGFTQDQLRAGKAVDYLAEQLDGFAHADIETFSGALKQAQNLASDIMKDIGESISTGLGGGALGAKKLVKTLEDIRGVIDDIGPAFSAAASVAKSFFLVLIDSSAIVVDSFRFLKDGLIGIFTGDFSKGATDQIDSLKEQITGMVVDIGDQFSNTAKSAVEIADATAEIANQGAKARLPFTDMNKALAEQNRLLNEQLKLVDAIRKLREDLAGSLVKAFGSEQDQIRLEMSARVAQINGLEEQLRQAKGLTKERQNQLNLARADAAAEFDARAAIAAQKEYLDVHKNTLDIQIRMNESGKMEIDLIDMRLEREKARLDLQIDRLSRDGDINQTVLTELEYQKELLDIEAKRAKVKLQRTQNFDTGQKAASGVADEIRTSFKEGAGFFGGFITGAKEIIGAVQEIVDLIPQLLSSATNLITSITSLPTRIAEGFKALLDAVDAMIASLIPNLIAAVEKILDTAIGFLEKIPETVAKMLTAIPEMLEHLIGRLPDLAQKLVESLIEAVPEIGISLVEFLIKDAPRIALKLAYALAIQLPIALVKGVIAAFKGIGGMISGLFKGSPIKVDTEGLKNVKSQIQSFGKTLTDEASNIFAVMDLKRGNGAGKQAQDLQNAIIEGASEAIEKMKGFFQKIWDSIVEVWNKMIGFLKEVWDGVITALKAVWDFVVTIFTTFVDAVKTIFQWVWDNVISPIAGLVMKAFQWVIDNIIMPIPGMVKKAFQWVYDNIISPYNDLVKKAFTWVLDNIITPIPGMVKKAFQWVVDNIITPYNDLVKKAFMWVYDKIIAPFNDLVVKAFQWVVDNVLTPIPDAVKGAFQWVVDNIITPLADIGQKAFQWVYDNIVEPYNDLIKKAFKWVVDNVVKKLGGIGEKGFTWVKENIIDGFAGVGKKAFEWVKTNIIDKFAGIGKESFQWVVDNVLTPLSGIGKVIAQPFVDAVAGLTSFFNGIGDAFKSLFKLDLEGFKKGIGEAFQGGLAYLFNPIADVLNSLIGALNNIKIPAFDIEFKIAGKKFGAHLWDDIDLIPGDIPLIQKFATGGLLQGPDGNDNLLYRGTSGEYMMNRMAVGNIGVPQLEALNRGASMPSQPSNVSIDIGGISITVPRDTEERQARMVVEKVMEQIRERSLKGQIVAYQSGIATR